MMVLQHERINLRAPIHRLGANLDGTDVRVVREQCCEQSDERVSSITVNLRQAIQHVIFAQAGRENFVADATEVLRRRTWNQEKQFALATI